MSEERTYYVLCEDNCRFEGLTKPQIIAEIFARVEERGMRAVSYNVPFSVREINAGKEFGLWIGTEEEYDSISNIDENVLYIIAEHNEAKQSIETSLESILNSVESMQSPLENVASGVEALKASKNEQQTARTSIRDDISSLTKNNILIRNRIAIDKSIAPEISEAFTNYISDRDEVEIIWSGAKKLGRATVLEHQTDYQKSFNDFREVLFVIENSDNNEDMPMNNLIYLPTNGINDSFGSGKYVFFLNKSDKLGYIHIGYISLNTIGTESIGIVNDNYGLVYLMKIIGIGVK